MLVINSVDELKLGDIIKVTYKNSNTIWWMFEVYTKTFICQLLDYSYKKRLSQNRSDGNVFNSSWFKIYLVTVLNR